MSKSKGEDELVNFGMEFQELSLTSNQSENQVSFKIVIYFQIYT